VRKRKKVQEVSRRLSDWRPRRRIVVFVAQLALGLVVLTATPVLVMRWVPPLTSAFMVQRWIGARLGGESGFALRHHWVPLREISPEMALAVIAAEDQKFAEHWGFDWDSIGDAISEGDARPRGASTLSQQAAKNLFLWSERSLLRKGLEAWFTLLLETLWPKRRILEVYLNVAEFGPGVYGVGAARERYFGVPPARLSRSQAALLAAVLPNPSRLRVAQPSRYVLGRAAWIERHVGHLGGRAYLARL
jgi:monofunctional biosynthetic peptidoglycan transglycosylase